MKRCFLIIALLLQAVLNAQPVSFPASPDKLYGQLFTDVQLSHIFKDSKTFADAVAKEAPDSILAHYIKEKNNKGFSLSRFVNDHFTLPPDPPSVNSISREPDIVQHIQNLWKTLHRKADEPVMYSSLLPLPHPYVVPGGRFREIYYWDSYFTMLGLVESKDTATVTNMIDDFAYLIETYGHIPNGNRSYYLSRSQPPFFALMVELLANAKNDKKIYGKYLPALEKEYSYWMNGKHFLSKQLGYRRLVKMKDGSMLNRYWDDVPTPRTESYLEDLKTANERLHSFVKPMTAAQQDEIRKATYYNIKAAAESGWDFSSRWFADTFHLATIQTIQIAPVDLNCLLYVLEKTIVKGLQETGGNVVEINILNRQAEKRKQAINKYFWDDDKGFYVDYNHTARRRSGIISAAGMLPFFVGIAPKQNIAPAVKTLKALLLKDGGIVSTPFKTNQQWDAPNGWAPQQWMTIKGLENYGESKLAKEIAYRWMKLNMKVYNNTGKLMEKYNVVDPTLKGGGGEYPTQDGFGWTNGVFLALAAKYGLPAN